jgi:hypothetical protein
MAPRSTWRAVTRIPLVRDNYGAVRVLNGGFYLLLALYRTRRFRDVERLQKLYFQMIESFAQYGAKEAKDTLSLLLAIPWLASRKRQVYELIAIYRRIIERLLAANWDNSLSVEEQAELNLHIRAFIKTFKELNGFGPQDEARVQALVKDPAAMKEMVKGLFESLHNSNALD